MRAREIMTPDPEFMLPADSIEDSARRMRDLDTGVMPVVDDPEALKLKGILTDRDIAVRHVADGCDGCSVQSHMSTGSLTFVGPDTEIHEVTRSMKEKQLRRMPVVDQDGRLVGIIAQADVAIHLGPDEPEEVEEMLGGISRPAQPDRA